MHETSTQTRDEYVRIGVAASMLGTSVRTLQRREAEGLIIPIRLPNGHRRYLVSDVEQLRERIRVTPKNVPAGAA